MLVPLLFLAQLEGQYHPPIEGTYTDIRRINVHIVIDESDYDINAFDAGYAVVVASQGMEQETGWGYDITGVEYATYGGDLSPSQIMRGYLDQLQFNGQALPHYVIVFAKDESSVSHGGHALGPVEVPDRSFCNPAGSPFEAPGVVYGAAIDWNHIVGTCGYWREGLTKTHVASFSFGGECRNTYGLTCELAFGAWHCPNLLANPTVRPLLEDPRLFTASTINHELLHFFGFKGAGDHSCSADVPLYVRERSWSDMCGTNVDTLRSAFTRCAQGMRHETDRCDTHAQCDTGLCKNGKCGASCRASADCPARPGYRKTCTQGACVYEHVDCLEYATSTACAYTAGVEWTEHVSQLP